MPKKKKTKKAAPKKSKNIAKKKVVKPAKKMTKAKSSPKKKITAVKAAPKEKLLGKVEHYFDKIMVAAVSVKAPFAVGDILHIKGHTTDLVERLDSMQIEHQSVAKVKKGDDVGIKVKGVVREHDLVYLSNEKSLTSQPVPPAAAVKTPQTFAKPQSFQQAMFPTLDPPKPAAAKPLPPAPPAAPRPAVQPKPQAKPDPYENKKFFSF